MGDVLWQSYNINHGNQCHAVSKTSSAALRFPQDPGLFWELGHLSTFKEVMVKYGQSAFQGARRARDIAFGGGLACTLFFFLSLRNQLIFFPFFSLALIFFREAALLA